MPALAHNTQPSPIWPAETGPDTRLDWLRGIGGRCRCTARADLFRACSVLSNDPNAAAHAYAEALFRAMPVGRLSFFRPGSAELSFDERWLIALLDAVRRDDQASLTFLLARRIPSHSRRQVGYLVTCVSRLLDKLA